MGNQQAFVSQGIYQQANLPQGAYKNTMIQGQVQVQNQGQMYNQGQVFNQRQQLTHQLSMNNNNLPQNYQGTNQQLNYYSSLQLGQSNVMNQLNQLNQATHTNIKGQINQMKEANFGSFGNQLQKINTTSSSSYNQTYHGSSGANNLNMQIYENGTNRQNYKKQIYYTLAS